MQPHTLPDAVTQHEAAVIDRHLRMLARHHFTIDIDFDRCITIVFDRVVYAKVLVGFRHIQTTHFKVTGEERAVWVPAG